MKMDLETLAKVVEEKVPTARAACIPQANQIVVTFTNRPDVEVALLTPWLHRTLKGKSLDSDELLSLLLEVKRIGGIQVCM